VVQELLNDLNEGGDVRDRLVANLITAVCKGSFPEATLEATAAIEQLRLRQRADQQEKAKQEQERREERRRRDDEAEERRHRAARQKAEERERFRLRFTDLIAQPDPQQRGYMLERFLNEFLAFEGLDPRASFKLIGEQIEGSFEWANKVHLVEARWVKNPIAGDGFSQLMYKIEEKSADTRGLFLSINSYSEKALEGLKMKGPLRFVCIDGAHLMRCLQPGGGFVRLLEV
jgi:hypothetical protein